MIREALAVLVTIGAASIVAIRVLTAHAIREGRR